MIPGAFEYLRPKTLSDAIAMLATHGDEARPLAGGHSLIPMMKQRLASPSHLVDLAAIADLAVLREEPDGLVIGAMVTQRALLGSALVQVKAPLLIEAAQQIADPQIRALGTLGGNVANGDPGNDMPAVMMCLDATYMVQGPKGARQIKAREFYRGAYDTALAAGEIVTAIQVPVVAGQGVAYEKLKRKVGDYAVAAAAVALTLRSGEVTSCAIGLTNVAPTPLWAKDAAALLVGTRLEADAVKKAVAAAEAITDPAADGRGPADYRRKMAGIMLARALARAQQRAA
ncbi:MAG: xanthine dehydrogenase family protein subunit M [Hyphomicrobiales bacterium]|nr:xanthine dehydrogenase family protein subunit M [Hyphomicrobiales bacterium]